MPRLHDVDTLTDLAGLLNLRDCWSVLAPSRTTEPWQSFNWIVACAESDRKIRRFHLVTVRYRGKLTAIAPFALRESSQPLHPLRLDFLGGEDIKEPNHFVSSNPESLELLVESLASERTYPIRLSRIPNERSLIEVVNRTFRARGWLTRMMSVPYPYLDLDDGSSLIKKSLEEDLRRARRKAEKK